MVKVTETSIYIILMSTIASLICLLPPEERRTVRKIESINKKISNTKEAVIFNKTCLNEGLLPNFSNIYMY